MESDSHLYHTVYPQTRENYSYVEPNPSPQGNADEAVYTYTGTPICPVSSSSSTIDASEEGWKDNIILLLMTCQFKALKMGRIKAKFIGSLWEIEKELYFTFYNYWNLATRNLKIVSLTKIITI